MAGEDLTSSELAEPPRIPLTAAEFDEHQVHLEDSLMAATAGKGMTRWFWGEGVCLLAATRLAAARGDVVCTARCERRGRSISRPTASTAEQAASRCSTPGASRRPGYCWRKASVLLCRMPSRSS